MSAIRNILGEVFGLFVDDSSFAVLLLLWIGLVWLLWQRWQLPVPGGVVLFLGLAAILVESVLRFSRQAVAREEKSRPAV